MIVVLVFVGVFVVGVAVNMAAFRLVERVGEEPPRLVLLRSHVEVREFRDCARLLEVDR